MNKGETVTTTLYGIPNCDTVKKARTWLEAKGVAYAFHDYKKLGVDREKLAALAAQSLTDARYRRPLKPEAPHKSASKVPLLDW